MQITPCAPFDRRLPLHLSSPPLYRPLILRFQRAEFQREKGIKNKSGPNSLIAASSSLGGVIRRWCRQYSTDTHTRQQRRQNNVSGVFPCFFFFFFFDSFIGFPLRNRFSTKCCLPYTGQLRKEPPTPTPHPPAYISYLLHRRTPFHLLRLVPSVAGKRPTLPPSELALIIILLLLSLLDVPGPRDCNTKRYGQRAFRYVAPLPLECPPRGHQRKGLHSIFWSFSENAPRYLGSIVDAIITFVCDVHSRWCVYGVH